MTPMAVRQHLYGLQEENSSPSRQDYQLPAKLKRLAKIRTEEGYMAEVQKGEDGAYC